MYPPIPNVPVAKVVILEHCIRRLLDYRFVHHVFCMKKDSQLPAEDRGGMHDVDMCFIFSATERTWGRIRPSQSMYDRAAELLGEPEWIRLPGVKSHYKYYLEQFKEHDRIIMFGDSRER